ncbi:MAG: hypothetical protein WA884_06885 [Methyloceanibacter sp.]|jgi:hypothetical protein
MGITETPEVRGRVVRFLTKREGAANTLEQWFLVGIDDDEKAVEAVPTQGADEVVEVVGQITPGMASTWGLRDGEVRLILPGEALI